MDSRVTSTSANSSLVVQLKISELYILHFFYLFFFLDLLYGDRTVTYFSLDTDEDKQDEQLFNPKQKVYSECVEDAVKDLLVSPEIDAQLKDCPIEIVDVSNFFSFVLIRLNSATHIETLSKSTVVIFI